MPKEINYWESRMCPTCGKPVYFFTKNRVLTKDVNKARFFKCSVCGHAGVLKKQLTLDEQNFISNDS